MRPTVILADYGGPETLGEVRPFLKRIFSDRRIIPLPAVARFPLAFLISRLRSGKSRMIYQQIGGSPVNRTVSEMCRRLNEMQGAIRFEPGFRYMAPFFREQVVKAASRGPVLVLPTFPHDSFSSYGSLADGIRGIENVQLAKPYYNNDTFIKLLSERIEARLNPPGSSPVAVLLTAHSIPESALRKGDVYINQVKIQAEEIRKHFPGILFRLAFQSPLGPVKWVGPFLEESVRDLVAAGVSRVLVVPLSFTVDNSETLYELDLYLSEFAGKIGIRQMDRVPCFNATAPFLKFLLAYAGGQLGMALSEGNPV